MLQIARLSPNFKSTRRNGPPQHVPANVSTSPASSCETSSYQCPSPLFSQEQYEELVKLLRKESTKIKYGKYCSLSTLSSQDWLLDIDSHDP